MYKSYCSTYLLQEYWWTMKIDFPCFLFAKNFLFNIGQRIIWPQLVGWSPDVTCNSWTSCLQGWISLKIWLCLFKKNCCVTISFISYAIFSLSLLKKKAEIGDLTLQQIGLVSFYNHIARTMDWGYWFMKRKSANKLCIFATLGLFLDSCWSTMGCTTC